MRADKGFNKGAFFKFTCGQVGAFHKKFGRWPKVSSADKEEERLGAWCHKVRLAYCKGKLDELKLKLLAEINFNFEPYKEQWIKNADALQPYLEKRELPPYGSRLRQFAYEQFQHYERLPEWKKAWLEEMKLVEVYQGNMRSEEGAWYSKFVEVLDFYNTHKKLPGRIANYELECWVSKQRQILKKGQMSEERIKLFEDAGIDLLKRSFTKIIVPWEERYADLKNFVASTGRMPGYKDDRSLYQWSVQQKKKLKEGKLNLTQADKLNKVISESYAQAG